MSLPIDPSLGATLEQLALREIAHEYRHLNWDRFGERLRVPMFRLIDSDTLLARWSSEVRCIEVARHLLFDHPWGVVREVLLHEMAHQFVDEVLGQRDEQAHGTLFRDACRRFHVDPRAQGTPAIPNGDTGANEAILDKIAKLLALATSPNPHEAQSAMNAAHRLMLKHNIERAQRDVARGYVWKHLGSPLKRIEAHRSLASVILSDYFFVEVIWTSVWDVRQACRGSVLEVCGTPENVDMAAYVYSFLVHTSEALWHTRKRNAGRGGLVARRSFLRGVMMGFRDKLETEVTRDREVGLVWVGDPALEAFHRGRYPHVRQRRTAGRHDAEAHAQGHAAGRSLVLRKAVERGAEGRGEIRQLPEGKR